LVGRTAVIENNIKKLGLRLEHGTNIEIVDQEKNPLYEEFWKDYHHTMQRKGVTEEYAQREARRRSTLIAALLVKFGKADGMLCGTYSSYDIHLDFVSNVIGLKEGVNNFFTLNALMLEDRNLFIADTYVNTNPTAEQLVDMTIMAAEEVRRFGITPRIALLSHSSFGSDQNDPSAKKCVKFIACYLNARLSLKLKVKCMVMQHLMKVFVTLHSQIRVSKVLQIC
jgi:malate dehydrogenase (oxaloacetate-decarboxylating)(NADP+)